jgi:hypothetical protein
MTVVLPFSLKKRKPTKRYMVRGTFGSFPLLDFPETALTPDTTAAHDPACHGTRSEPSAPCTTSSPSGGRWPNQNHSCTPPPPLRPVKVNPNSQPKWPPTLVIAHDDGLGCSCANACPCTHPLCSAQQWLACPSPSMGCTYLGALRVRCQGGGLVRRLSSLVLLFRPVRGRAKHAEKGHIQFDPGSQKQSALLGATNGGYCRTQGCKPLRERTPVNRSRNTTV